MKTSSFHIPEFREDEVAPHFGQPDAENEVKQMAGTRFLLLYPVAVIAEQLQAAGEAAGHLSRQLERAYRQAENTRLHVVSEERDPEAKASWIESAFGILCVVLLSVTLTAVPAIAAMLIAEGGKIALVADFPLFGMIFGVSALAGVLASVDSRRHLASDVARDRFDRAMLCATIIVFLCWSLTLSLSAYPASFGGGDLVGAAGAQDWGVLSGPLAGGGGGFTIKAPTWLVFSLTALMDILAAPVLHQFAMSRLSPRPLKRVMADAEQVWLRDEEVPSWEAELDEANEHLRQLTATLQSWEAAKSTCELNAVNILGRLVAKAESAERAASVQVLYPASPPVGAPGRPNGLHS